MSFRYTNKDTEHEFTDAELRAAQDRLKVSLSIGGDTVLVTRPTGPDLKGMFVKAPFVIADKHLHLIPEPGAIVLLGTDETAAEKTAARHPWRKKIDFAQVSEEFDNTALLEGVQNEINAAVSKLTVTTNVTGWVLTDTPFGPSMKLSRPPTMKKREVSLDLVLPAPKIVHASEFVRKQVGTIGLHVEKVGGLLASQALVFAVPATRGWVAVPLSLIAKVVGVASEAAEPLLSRALGPAEAHEALSEMTNEVLRLARWFPEIMRRSGMQVPHLL